MHESSRLPPLPNRVRKSVARRTAQSASGSSETGDDLLPVIRARMDAASALRALGQRVLAEITVKDARFGRYVQSLSSSARDLSAIATDHTLIRRRLSPDQIASIIADLNAELRAARGATLVEEIFAVYNPQHKRAHEAVLHRLGLLGAEPMTLQQAGELFGITRERVRQVQAAPNGIFRRKSYMPVYSRAVAALNQAVMADPRTLSEVQSELRSAGILSEGDLVSQVIQVAELREEAHSIVTRELGYEIVGFPNHLKSIYEATSFVRELIEKETKAHGVCLRETAATALEQYGYAAYAVRERLDLILKGIVDLVTFEQDGRQWLHVGRAFTIALMARKILCISPRVKLSDLRRGIQRHHRVKAVPPAGILGRLVALELASWDIQIDGDWVSVSQPMSPSQVLAPLEMMFFEALRASGGVLSRTELHAEMKASGVNISTFGIMLGYSPFIVAYGRGVYGLRGVTVTPGQVEALSAVPNRSRHERDFGHLKDGRVWMTKRLGEYEVDHRVIYEPAAIREYVPDGEYSVLLDGMRTPYVASLSVSQIRLRGNLLEAIGGEEGDYVAVAFNRNAKTVEIAIGTESADNVLRKISGNEPAAVDSEKPPTSVN